MTSSHARQDPFERTRAGTLKNLFERDLEYQWQLDLYKKLWGKDLGQSKPGNKRSVRIVVRRWPRAPNGTIISQLPEGFTTPSSTHLWGERFLDFFCLSRGTDWSAVHNQLISTSSRLSAWMKANGETEYAKDELMWAETEEPPRLRVAADIMEILNARDLLIMMGSCGVSLRDDESDIATDDDVNMEPEVSLLCSNLLLIMLIICIAQILHCSVRLPKLSRSLASGTLLIEPYHSPIANPFSLAPRNTDRTRSVSSSSCHYS